MFCYIVFEIFAQFFDSFFRNEKNKESLRRLKKAVGDFKSLEGGGEFDGVKMTFTGAIEGYTRDEIENLMESHGAEVTSSVSTETDFLIVGENPGQRKLESAGELNTEVLSIDGFRERFLDEIT